MPHPQHPHLLLSAVEGNNEVSAWNMETGQKKLMLWGVSQVPPFSRSSKVGNFPNVAHYIMQPGLRCYQALFVLCRSVATQVCVHCAVALLTGTRWC